MRHNHEQYHNPDRQESWWKSPSGIVAIIFFIFAGYFLITEHSAHIIPYLPYLIILLCPLMHIFHHGGHGSHKHEDKTHSDKEE